MLPKIAEGDANKVWIVPSEIGQALEGLGSTITRLSGIPDKDDGRSLPGWTWARTRPDPAAEIESL